MGNRTPPLVFLGIVIYCLWSSTDLILAWKGERLDQFSWIVLLIWIVPILTYWLVPFLYSNNKNPNNYILCAVALIFAVVGNLGSLNLLKYFGLAMAISSLLPWSLWLLPWILSSIAWMPGFGWVAVRYNYGSILPYRPWIAFFGSLWVILFCGILKKGDD